MAKLQQQYYNNEKLELRPELHKLNKHDRDVSVSHTTTDLVLSSRVENEDGNAMSSPPPHAL